MQVMPWWLCVWPCRCSGLHALLCRREWMPQGLANIFWGYSVFGDIPDPLAEELAVVITEAAGRQPCLGAGDQQCPAGLGPLRLREPCF